MVPFRITVCGIEELTGHCETGASHVLSILDPDWPIPDAFGGFGVHQKLELRFHDVIEDSGGLIPPRSEHVERLLSFSQDLHAEPPDNAHLLVHCHAGISRSTASMALILAQGAPSLSGTEILQEILRIRPKAWPNLRIIEMGDAMLSRDGELTAAAIEIYRHQLEIRPELADFMIRGGRIREVQAARALPGARSRGSAE